MAADCASRDGGVLVDACIVTDERDRKRRDKKMEGNM